MTKPWQRHERIGGCDLYLGDCLDVMPELGPVDLAHTDPPFGVGNFVQTSGRLMGRGKNRGKAVTWNDAGPPAEFFDQLRSMSRHRIVWGANFFNCFESKGGAIIWDKCQQMPNFSKADIASCTHYQKTEIVRIPWTNFTAARLAETDHPSERPIALYEWALKYIPNSGPVVLDPFMGSGTTGVACVNLGRRFVGIELDPDYYDIACRRIDEATRQPRLDLEPVPKPEQTGFEL